MPRETLAEISVGEFPNGSRGMLRVLRDHDRPGLFTLVEADPTALARSTREGTAFKWANVTDTDGLTPEQLGSIIVERIQRGSTR